LRDNRRSMSAKLRVVERVWKNEKDNRSSNQTL
jgi:hypothetical protein